MQVFAIDADDNITAYASARQARAAERAEVFTSEKSLAELASRWPASRLVEIWNSLSGMTPVRKFTNRKTAVSRIWKATQSLGDCVTPAQDLARTGAKAEPEIQMEEARQAAPAPLVAPVPVRPSKKARPDAQSPTSAAPANGSRPASKTATVLVPRKDKAMTALGGAARDRSKRARILELMRQEQGVTLEAIMAETGWQKHTVRGFVSGSLVKKGVAVESYKRADGQRAYRLQS